MKLFPKRVKCALIAGLCWTNNSPFARANYATRTDNFTALRSVSNSYLPTDPIAISPQLGLKTDDSRSADVGSYDTEENSTETTDDYSDDDDFTLNNTGKADMNVPPHLLGRTKLPNDDDSWENIHKSKSLFVDKTRFLHKFVNDATQLRIFVKPRRFGKTMFLQTIQSFFMGQQNYFNGTEVSVLGNTPHKDGTWKEYPVVYINFAEINTEYFTENLPVDETMRKLHYFINQYLRDATEYFLKIDTTQHTEYSVSQLTFQAYKKFNVPLVILIDEYDAIITEAQKTHNEDLLNRILADAEGFYKNIKAAAAAGRVKLALVTGVHKFAINAMQSGPNSFMDISWDPELATSIGFTRTEIKTTFKSNIVHCAARRNQTPKDVMNLLREMYDGYNFGYDVFDRTHNVYNPVSVISALRECSFDPHWCGTETSDYVVRQMYETASSLESFENLELRTLQSKDADHKELLRSMITNPPDIRKAVDILNKLGFPIFKHPLDNKASEYDVTRRISMIFNCSSIKHDYRVLRNTKNNQKTAGDNLDKGDIDLYTTNLPINFIIEIKVSNATVSGYEKILNYFIDHQEIFKNTIKFNNNSRVHLLALTFYNSRNNQIYSWALIPCKDDKILINQIEATNSTLLIEVKKYIENKAENHDIPIVSEEEYKGDCPIFDLLT